MKTIKELYRIGTGPSSSHTMGPRKAAEIYLERFPKTKAFEVVLYGSLAATGRGHMTDVAILDTLEPHATVNLVWKPKEFLPFHPNAMTFKALDKDNNPINSWTVYSIERGTNAELMEQNSRYRDFQKLYSQANDWRLCDEKSI